MTSTVSRIITAEDIITMSCRQGAKLVNIVKAVLYTLPHIPPSEAVRRLTLDNIEEEDEYDHPMALYKRASDEGRVDGYDQVLRKLEIKWLEYLAICKTLIFHHNDAVGAVRPAKLLCYLKYVRLC